METVSKERYDVLMEAALELAESSRIPERIGAISHNTVGIRKGCDAVFTMYREDERVKFLKENMDTPYQFRTKPKDLNEMIRWGMISHKLFQRYCHIKDPVEAMKTLLANENTNDYFSYHDDHIREYIRDRNINVHKDFKDLNAFMSHIIKMTKGKVTPPVIKRVWEETKPKLEK